MSFILLKHFVFLTGFKLHRSDPRQCFLYYSLKCYNDEDRAKNED